MSVLESAIYTAVLAHAGQFDQDDMPHIIHSMEVMMRVQKMFDKAPVEGFSAEEIMAASILHDVAEDSVEHGVYPVTLADIRKTYGDKIADMVDAVTRRVNEKESYRDFIYRAKAHPAARLIKLGDLLHNISRTNKISDTKAKWRKKLEYKYMIAERVLNDSYEPTWEGASFEYKSDGSNVGNYFIADPNGKRIEITKAEADNVRMSFRISN